MYIHADKKPNKIYNFVFLLSNTTNNNNIKKIKSLIGMLKIDEAGKDKDIIINKENIFKKALFIVKTFILKIYNPYVMLYLSLLKIQTCNLLI
jgi:hypothetical protein